MGTVPSENPIRGVTRIASGADTHYLTSARGRRLAGEMVQNVSVHPAGGAESYPLSPLQQGMLFHRLEARSPGVDLEQCICELHEEIDVARFDRAWREVVARHAILRTSFVWNASSEPRQVIVPAAQVRLSFQHMEFGSEREARHGLEAYLADDRRAGFASLEAPLLRIALLRGGPRRHWWVATFHHLLLDGRALVVLFKEAHEIHDALVAGRTIDLPPPRPYRAYIDWLQTLYPARAETFWREQLAGLSAPTLLPIARRETPALDDVAARGELAFRLSAAKTAELRAAAKQHDVTLNTLVQAAWALVLSRYTGEDEVVFGAVRACRHIPVEGAASMVGLFINTVPVRVGVPSAAPLATWLRTLRETWVALRDYEHTPLMQVQQWSGIAPGQPLFETLLNFQDPSWDTALRELGGNWAAREFDIRSQPNYPLAVDAYGGAAVIVKMLYDRRRFDDEAIARLLCHYRVVLEAFAGPAATVGELPMLTAREERQVLHEWQGETLPSSDTPVHTLVEEHARRTPAAPAVADGREAWTYAELDRRAGALAARLRELGVQRETIVAVCLERSAEMIAAWLGILKAGGAFLPIDPQYPAERIRFMLEDSGAPVVIRDGLQAERVGNARPPLAAGVRPASDLAYVIYTSGSTGQPKGVQVEQRALLNLVAWHQHAFRVTAADRATQLASPAFDASVWEVWPYLAAGASVHIPDEDTRISPAALWRWLAAQRITISFLPTPLAEAMMDEPWPEGLALRALLTGGDKLKRRPPANFPCALINNYGPTENAVVSTSGVVAAVAAPAGAPSIGRPIANTRCLILDRALRPVPVGVTGELFVGGASLARGYLDRPQLTAERFPPLPAGLECHPLDDKLPAFPGKGRIDCHLMDDNRVYRTGDLARWTAEGEIEFIGRLDHQVKIRGHRIELGEIEGVLQSHPAVREALVVARADERAGAQLVAYALAECHPLGDNLAAQVVEHLRGKLPAYMVPSALVFLESWPLTPNGKIDRAALPAPRATPNDAAIDTAAPHTPTELAVARIWAEILGRTSVGRHENFFDLGGHSLLAAQVVSRLNQSLQAALTVRAVFDQPTVAGLAREVDARRRAAPLDSARPLIARVKRRAVETEVLQPN